MPNLQLVQGPAPPPNPPRARRPRHVRRALPYTRRIVPASSLQKAHENNVALATSLMTLAILVGAVVIERVLETDATTNRFVPQ